MKKKFLSLALVLAMALTLLPTAAFAAKNEAHKKKDGSDCTGTTLTWDTSTSGKHSATCSDSENCDGIAEADCTPGTWTSADDTNHTTTCTICEQTLTEAHAAAATPQYVRVDDNNHATKCGKCTGTVKDSSTAHTYPSSGGTSNGASGHTLTCTASGCGATKTEAHDNKGTGGTCSVCSYDPNAGSGDTKTISNVSATYNKTTRALSVSWETANISDGTYTVSITGTNAPTLGSTATGILANTKTFSITLDADKALTAGQTYTITVTYSSDANVKGTYSLKVPADSETPSTDPLPISVSAAFVDARTVRVAWTNPSGVAAGAVYHVDVNNETSTITGSANNATSPATITLNQAVANGTQVGVLVVATPASANNVLARGSVKITYTASTAAGDTTPPSTNDQGIPVASEVKNEKQADAAVEILKNTDTADLAKDLMNSTAAASSFESLDRAVKSAKDISVTVDVDKSSTPSAVRSGVSVVGAALNASGSKVALVVNAPSKSYTTSSGYQISMTMTGVSNPAKLAVPVIITLPLPSDVQAGRVVVLHYHDGSNPTVIVPVVSGSWLRFPVTGFSDFVITDQESAGNSGVSQAFTTVQGGSRDDGSLDDATLAAISAMLSGDGVFVDVPGAHWAAKEIRWARDGGLMSGYGNGNFGPTASTTRQQLWMVLARLSGTRPADMAEARQWAINTGVSDGSNPSGVLSRQQLVTMLYRFAKSQGVNVSASAKLSGYTDSAKVASYAKEALSWAAAKGIMSGSNGKLNPEGNATRAHFAVFLYRYSNG